MKPLERLFRAYARARLEAAEARTAWFEGTIAVLKEHDGYLTTSPDAQGYCADFRLAGDASNYGIGLGVVKAGDRKYDGHLAPAHPDLGDAALVREERSAATRERATRIGRTVQRLLDVTSPEDGALAVAMRTMNRVPRS